MKIGRFIKQKRIGASVGDVFAWHERPGAIERLSPPWDDVTLVSQSNGILPGSEVRLRIPALGPVRLNWTARHTAYEKNRLFQDTQEKGPFSSWTHTHRFTPDGDAACIVEDDISYTLPFHPVSTAVFDNAIRSRLCRIFRYRHETTAADIANHLEYGMKPSKILVSGSSGLIAATLIPFLTTGGHTVFRLVRTRSRTPGCIYFNPETGFIEVEKMEGIDAVIHLAGENIGNGPWTSAKKRRIMESRTRSTALLAGALAKMRRPPKLFACASAIGYYGDREDKPLSEDAGPGRDFISRVCREWEYSARAAVDAGIRTVFMRIGVALTPRGGALGMLLPAFRAGLGGKLGTGRQYLSWVSVDDVAGSILHIMAKPGICGPVNLVAPNPVSNRLFSETLGKVIARPLLPGIPATAVKMIFGQMGKETALSSTRAIPDKLLATGYRFRHPDLETALSHLLGTTLHGNRRI